MPAETTFPHLYTHRFKYGLEGSSDSELSTVTIETGSTLDFGSIDWNAFHVAIGVVFRNAMATNYTLDRIVSSTWVPDGMPYDPLTFTSTTLSYSGLLLPLGTYPNTALPIEIAALFRKNTDSGRPGMIYFRGHGMSETELSVGPNNRWYYSASGVTRADAIADVFNTILTDMGGAGLQPILAGRSLVQHNWTIVDGKPVDNPTYGDTHQRAMLNVVSVRPIVRQVKQ